MLLGALQICAIPSRIYLSGTFPYLRYQELTPKMLFDSEWYKEKYALSDKETPYIHFMTTGWKLGYNPNPFFDVNWYSSKYSVFGNPLKDYILWKGRRNPHPLFDVGYYLRRHPDIVENKTDGLLHFLIWGRYEQRNPHPLFDAKWYSEKYEAAAKDPFAHYLENGNGESYDPHPLFSTEWYRLNNPEIIGEDSPPLVHFVERGAMQGRDPHPFFSAQWYLERNPDVAREGMNPLAHYLLYGAMEERDPHPHFQTNWYLSAYADVRESSTNPLTHFFVHGMAEGRKPNFVFDPAWYSRRYARLLGDAPAFLHFVTKGRFANLQPGPFFSPKSYRSRYSLKGRAAADPTGALLDHARAMPSAERFDLGLRLADVVYLKPVRSAPDLSPWFERLLPFQEGKPARIGVHVHLFYVDVIDRIFDALKNIPFRFDLFVSITNPADRTRVNRVFAKLPTVSRVEIAVVPNRGRDIAPLVVSFGAQLAKYEFVLHIHTKKSPHVSDLSGWFDYLIENLLGSPENVAAIIKAFDERADLGLLYPATYEPVQRFMRLGANGPEIRKLHDLMGGNFSEIDPLLYSTFPSGSMLWMRGAVMGRINQLELALADFPEEQGQDDGTIAHALERLLPHFALRERLDVTQFVRGDGLFDEWCGAWRASKDLEADVIVVDHNAGGGSNAFTNYLIADYLEQGKKALRIYFNEVVKRITIEYATPQKKLFYVAQSGESFAEVIARTKTREIVINSLYGLYSEIGGVIAAIETAKRDHGVKVRLMVHDFLLACPSQHLLNWKQEYCGLPQLSSAECNRCVARNENISEEWRRYFNLSAWRLQSQALVALCDEVRFFDPSGLDLLSQAIEIPSEAQTIAPHRPLHSLRRVRRATSDRIVVGVLGSLQYAKGVKVINQLAAYINGINAKDKIVVIGNAYQAIDASVHVHGPYRVDDLPSIVEEHGVNVVFISSVVPETFCYTLSEAMAMDLPILGFDLGAQGSRIKSYALGQVTPIDTPIADIYTALVACGRRASDETHANDQHSDNV
jgi:hypothetical protein